MLSPLLEVSFFLLYIFSSVPYFEAKPLGMPLGSKISVARQNYWSSPNGDFALGFFNHSDLPNQYGLGILFNSADIPKCNQTVVWVAGGNVFVGHDSYLHLTKDGDLVLFDRLKGMIAWSSNTSHSSVALAALLDYGNFVLLNGDHEIVWQSFETPSDTLLPGQSLRSGQTLRAASRNSISSYYSLSMDPSGQLKLSWETNVSYWRTEATSSLPIFAAKFTNAGSLELLDKSLVPVYSAFANDHNDSSVQFRFLRLDVDGNLRMYSWDEVSRSWKPVWQAVQNQCEVFATCGRYGICGFTPFGTTTCKCPYHLAPNSSLDCLTPYKQKCSSGISMLTLEHTLLYGFYPPHDLVTHASLEGCKNSCLKDPLCTSVTMTNDGSAECHVKRTQYVTGYQHPSLASVSFVKVCLDPIAVLPQQFPLSPPSPSPSLGDSHSICTRCLIGAIIATFLILFVIQIIVGLYFLRRRKAAKKMGNDFKLHSIGVVSLSYIEIKNLTNNFANQLGSNMYRGVFPNNQMVVIKDLKAIANIEEKQCRCWISVLGSIYHKNLMKLEAYCFRSEQKFLVYRFAKNGSVDKWISEPKLAKRLNWSKRMEICLGVARAVAYLHSGCREFFSHGNLKWKNVVLDEELEAKVTEYGFGRFGGGTCQSSHPAEEDVAKFGEMLVVLVTGSREGGSEVCWWAYKEWVEGHLDRLVDSRMGGKADFQEVERTLRLAFWCVQDDERLRPSMNEVAKVLEGSLSVDPPPPPFRTPEDIGEPTFDIGKLS